MTFSLVLRYSLGFLAVDTALWYSVYTILVDLTAIWYCYCIGRGKPA